MKTVFDMTKEGFKQAKEYLRVVGKLEKFYQNGESTDGYSLVYYANYLKHKETEEKHARPI